MNVLFMNGHSSFSPSFIFFVLILSNFLHRMLAFQARINSNEALVDNLVSAKVIINPEVAKIMKRVDRGLFVPEGSDKYADSPQRLDDAVTISAPHMHAKPLQTLMEHCRYPCHVLDIGSGSGIFVAYASDYLEQLAKKHPSKDGTHRKSVVVGVEISHHLVKYSRERLAAWEKQRPDGPLQHVSYEIHHGNGWNGYTEHAPYQYIHVGAAAESLPSKLVDQLAVMGVLELPLESDSAFGRMQLFEALEKQPEGRLKKLGAALHVQYVPLVNRDEAEGKKT